jgi:hypothetical protein
VGWVPEAVGAAVGAALAFMFALVVVEYQYRRDRRIREHEAEAAAAAARARAVVSIREELLWMHEQLPTPGKRGTPLLAFSDAAWVEHRADLPDELRPMVRKAYRLAATYERVRTDLDVPGPLQQHRHAVRTGAVDQARKALRAAADALGEVPTEDWPST